MKLRQKKSMTKNDGKGNTKESKLIKHGVLSNEGKEVNINELPFPRAYLKNVKMGKERQDHDLLKTFKKVEVNILLLDLIKKIPKYANDIMYGYGLARNKLGN